MSTAGYSRSTVIPSLVESSIWQLAILPDDTLISTIKILPADLRAELLLSLEPGRQYLALNAGLAATHEPNRDERLINAASRGDLLATKLAEQQGATDFPAAIAAAVEKDQLAIVRLLAPKADWRLLKNLPKSSLSMTLLLRELYPIGAKTLAQNAVIRAIEDDDTELAIRLMEEADPIRSLKFFVMASNRGQLALLRWIVDWSRMDVSPTLFWIAALLAGDMQLVEELETQARNKRVANYVLDWDKAMERATKMGNAEAVHYLLLNHDYQGKLQDALFYAVTEGGNQLVVQMLLQQEIHELDVGTVLTETDDIAMIEWFLNNDLLSEVGKENLQRIAAKSIGKGEITVGEQLLALLEGDVAEQLVKITPPSVRQRVYNLALNTISKGGDVQLAEWALSQGAMTREDMITSAIFNLPMLKLLLADYPGSILHPLEQAIEHSQLGAIRLLLHHSRENVLTMSHLDEEVEGVLRQEGLSSEDISLLKGERARRTVAARATAPIGKIKFIPAKSLLG